MPPLPLAASELLPILGRHGVRSVVVGAVAAVAAGAPLLTQDLDLVIDFAADNLERVLAACRELGALYRDPAGRTLEPTLESLRTFRLHLLRTRKGDLDLMREIGDGWTYSDLVPRSDRVDLGTAWALVLRLDAVIESKRFADREKDRAQLPVLRETLRLQRLKSALDSRLDSPDTP